jgi:hypothetical protein
VNAAPAALWRTRLRAQLLAARQDGAEAAVITDAMGDV